MHRCGKLDWLQLFAYAQSPTGCSGRQDGPKVDGMIVRYESDGSIVMITQNDHAQLSGLFAAHWGNQTYEKPHPYDSLVRAAMFHDRGWIRYETSPQLNPETGKTPNYREVPNVKAQL